MSDFKSIGGTVRARAANELRDRILTGRLRPGDPRSISTRSPRSSAPAARRSARRCSSSPTRAWSRSRPAAASPCSASPPTTRSTTSPCSPRWPARRPSGPRPASPPSSSPSSATLADAIDGADDVVAANRRSTAPLNLASGSPRLLTYLRQAVRVVPGQLLRAVPRAGADAASAEHAALLDAIEPRRRRRRPHHRRGPRPRRRRGARRLAPHPRRRRRRRLVAGEGAVEALDAVDEGAGEVVDAGPPSEGPRPRTPARGTPVISGRARWAPRQKCGPAPPKARWSFGVRPTSKRDGSSKTALVAVGRAVAEHDLVALVDLRSPISGPRGGAPEVDHRRRPADDLLDRGRQQGRPRSGGD